MNKERLNYYKEWIEENEEIVVDSSIFKELVDEIERLNNITDELEKWCDIQFQIYKDLDKIQDSRISCQYLRMKDKLKELKEGKE